VRSADEPKLLGLDVGGAIASQVSMRTFVFLAASLFVAPLVGACGTSGQNAPAGADGGGPISPEDEPLTDVERCTRLCTEYDAKQVGVGYLQCAPKMFMSAPGSYKCKDLCTSITTSTCGDRLRTFVKCAFPCVTASDTSCLLGQVNCMATAACDSQGVENGCATEFKRFLESGNVQLPDGGPPRVAQVECNRVCERKAQAGCPESNCNFGCSLYASYPQKCQAAAVVEADCYLVAADVCKATCSAQVQAKLAACN
jgi:hypothetical protein